MASSQEYLDFILKQLEGLGQEISFRKMMESICSIIEGAYLAGFMTIVCCSSQSSQLWIFLKIRFMSLLIQAQNQCFI